MAEDFLMNTLNSCLKKSVISDLLKGKYTTKSLICMQQHTITIGLKVG